MTIEEKKTIVDFVINKLMGLQGFIDIIPDGFELNGYDLDARVIKGFDDTFKDLNDSADRNISEIANFLHKLDVTE